MGDVFTSPCSHRNGFPFTAEERYVICDMLSIECLKSGKGKRENEKWAMGQDEQDEQDGFEDPSGNPVNPVKNLVPFRPPPSVLCVLRYPISVLRPSFPIRVIRVIRG